MSHFKANGGGGDERLYISWSADGLNWTALNGGLPVWQPPGWAPFGNVVRDPTIIYSNGYYWVAYTAGNYGKGSSFGLVKSSDLLNWTFVTAVDASLAGATDQLTWNPVFFQDGDGTIHVQVSLSPTGGSQYNPVPNMRVHEMHPVSSDWTQWSAPVPLDLPSTNTNEGWVWKEADTYHIIYVSFTQGGQIVHATSRDLINGWTFDKILGFGGQEGGMILPKPTGGYRLYTEGGNGSALGYWTCDFDSTFTNPTPQVLVNATVPMQNGKMCAARNVTTFAQWQTQNLSGLPAARQEPLADADDDGLSNLIEYTIGSDPLGYSPEVQRPRGYTRSDATAVVAGMTYDLIRSCSDLAAKGELKIGDAGWTSTPPDAVTESIALLSDGTVRFHLRAAQPVASDPVLFRLSSTLTSTASASKVQSLSTVDSLRKTTRRTLLRQSLRSK